MHKERDIEQRNFGCMSFSFLAHTVVIATLFILPQTPIAQIQEGTLPIQTTYVDLQPVAQGETPIELPTSDLAEKKPSEETQLAAAPEPVVDDVDAVIAPPAPPKEKPKKIKAQVAVAKTPKSKKAVAATHLPTKKTSAKPVADELPPIAEDRSSEIETEASTVREVVDQENVDAGTATAVAPTEKPEPKAAEQDEEESPAVAAAATKEEDSSEIDKELDDALSTSKSEPVATPAPVVSRAEKQAPIAKAAAAPSSNSKPAAPVGLPSGIRDASELAERPGNRPPEYPTPDRLAGNQGTVVFVAKVNPDGSVRDIMVERGAKSKSLDLAAFDAMKRWRFLPGQEGFVRKAFTFNLQGNAAEMPARLRRGPQATN